MSEIFIIYEIAAVTLIIDVPATSTTSGLFQIDSIKVYIAVVILSINDNI